MVAQKAISNLRRDLILSDDIGEVALEALEVSQCERGAHDGKCSAAS